MIFFFVEKMVNMIEKKLSQLPALKGCSVDGDCGVFGKCMEVPKSGKRMCMPGTNPVHRFSKLNSTEIDKKQNIIRN